MPTITPSSLQALVSRYGQLHRTLDNQVALRDGRTAEFTRVQKQRFAMEDKVQKIRNAVSVAQQCMTTATAGLEQGRQELRTLDQWSRHVGKWGESAAYRMKEGQLRPLQSRNVLRNLLGIGKAARERQRVALEQRTGGGSSGSAIGAWLSTQRDALNEKMTDLQKQQTQQHHFRMLLPKVIDAIGEAKAKAVVARLQVPGAWNVGLASLADAVSEEGREPLVRREAGLIHEAGSFQREIDMTRKDYVSTQSALRQAQGTLSVMERAIVERLKTCMETLEATRDTMRVHKARLSTDSGVGPEDAEDQEQQLADLDVCKADMSVQRQVFDEQQVLNVQLFQVREMLGLLPPL